MEAKNELYPNQPLVEVVFEIRFPAEPMIECKRYEFYDRIRQNYSNVIIPSIQQSPFPALNPYRFEKADGSAGTMIAIDKFSYYSHRYPGYYEFKKEFLFLVSEFNKLFNLTKLIRVGWRYVNIIPFTRENGYVPLKRFFNLTLHFGKDISDECENLSITLVSKKDDYSITTRLENVKAPEESGEALHLDFDCFKGLDLSFSEIETHIERTHGIAKKMFEQIITADYREYLRGVKI
jgi:uncharacterized protein (TIGR04255 family)